MRIEKNKELLANNSQISLSKVSEFEGLYKNWINVKLIIVHLEAEYS